MSLSAIPLFDGPAIPLFEGLTSTEIAEALAQGRTLNVAPKTHLCTAGEMAERIFVLMRGRLKFFRTTADGDERLLTLFTPGQCFGLSAVLPEPHKYVGTAEALVESEIVFWSHTQIRELVSYWPQIMTNALRISIHFVESVITRHSRLFEDDATDRIARALVGFGERTGEVHSDGIDVRITNEQLGALADVSRFTASRVLSKWHKAGVITKKREAVRIHAPEDLLST
jgi:CRP-like cAMP-binding protein